MVRTIVSNSFRINASPTCKENSSTQIQTRPLMPPTRCCYCGVSRRPHQQFLTASSTVLQHAADLRAVGGAPPHAAALHICPSHQRRAPPSASSVVLQQLKDTTAGTLAREGKSTQVGHTRNT